VQGLRNVLANERLFLPTVDTTIDLLGIAHGRIMPYLLTVFAVMSRESSPLFWFSLRGGKRYTAMTRPV